MEHPPLTKKEVKDLKVLGLFTSVYCQAHHDAEKHQLDAESIGLEGVSFGRRMICAECHEFLDYAIQRRLKCPLDPKPTCKHCRIHCFRTGHREKVREIMRFSGKHLMLRGRLDLLWRYFF
jgi:hypothetical protein